MAKRSSSEVIGRRTEAKAPNGKENWITSGGIETAVHAFSNGIFNPSSPELTYGEHKKPGSEMAPLEKGGRGKSGSFFRKNLLEGGD